MLTRAERVQAAVQVVAMCVVMFGTTFGSLHAAQSVAQGPVAKETEAQRAAREQAEDDEEDAFFSSGSKRGATDTIANANPQPTQVRSGPSVDVVATCQAVLADNLNYYNYNFIEGCKRAVASLGVRRILR